MTDDIAEVAKGLTKAQREVINDAWAYPDFHRQGEQVSYCPVQINAANGAALERLGLASMKADGGPRLTPLGLAVRSYLQSKGDVAAAGQPTAIDETASTRDTSSHDRR